MKEPSVHTIDLKFLGIDGTIASYMIPHSGGVVLVECGPGSTVENLEKELSTHGLEITDISDVLLTHIHLDHAGAAGYLAKHGANVYVHPVGAPHMTNPEKLLSSAGRIYGDMMDSLWGEFLPIPEERLRVPEDGDMIEINELQFRTLDTPGHAGHHYAYIFEDLCFSGDIGGVRLRGTNHIRLPMPPPEFVLEDWNKSLARLQEEYNEGNFSHIAPTHFGVFHDPSWHLKALGIALVEINNWIEAVMPDDPAFEILNNQFVEWSRERSIADGVPEAKIDAYEAANPSWMSTYGIQRYWRKYRIKD